MNTPISIDTIKMESRSTLIEMLGSLWILPAFEKVRWVDLSNVQEPPETWLSVMGDDRLEPWRRGFAVVQFLMRHTKGKSLNQVLSVIPASLFSSIDDICSIGASTGPQFVTFPQDSYSCLFIRINLDCSYCLFVNFVTTPELSSDPEQEDVDALRVFKTRICDEHLIIFDITCSEKFNKMFTIWSIEDNKQLFTRGMNSRMQG